MVKNEKTQNKITLYFEWKGDELLLYLTFGRRKLKILLNKKYK